MAEPLDLGRTRMLIEEARGFIPEDGDPEAYIAAALQDAEEILELLEASRQAGDQLRAVLDDLISMACKAANAWRVSDAEVERVASQAVRLLGAIRSPDEAVDRR